MLSLEITTNAFVFGGAMIASGVVGMIFRSTQLSKSRLRIISLEQEIMGNHAEILELQKDFVALELKIHNAKDSVIKMKKVLATSGEKLPDVSLRKKLLAKENAPEKNETLTVVYNNLLSKQA
jgi:hypothetical protein